MFLLGVVTDGYKGQAVVILWVLTHLVYGGVQVGGQQ